MNLIPLEQRELTDSDRVALRDARAAHLLNVLRVTPGQTVRVGLLDGPRGIGTVEQVQDGQVTLQCAFETETPPRPRVDVLLALPRPKVMRRLWSQLAALGVGRIILTNAERVERHYFDTHILTEASYRPLLIEGLQQARDTRVPLVSIHRQFKILVEDHLDGVYEHGTRLVADPGDTTSIASAVSADPSAVSADPSAVSADPSAVSADPNQRVLLAIGPEGGWNAYELGLLKDHGFRGVSLGPRTLRVDTACIALVTLAHATLTFDQ